MTTTKPIQQWLVNSKHIEETVYGTVLNALMTACQIALIESEWPKRSGVVIPVTITRNDFHFTLTLDTAQQKEG